MLLDITDSDLEIQYEPAGLTFVKNRIGSPDKAREEKLSPDDVMGGTVTISVLGGVDGFTPILNAGDVHS